MGLAHEIDFGFFSLRILSGREINGVRESLDVWCVDYCSDDKKGPILGFFFWPTGWSVFPRGLRGCFFVLFKRHYQGPDEWFDISTRSRLCSAYSGMGAYRLIFHLCYSHGLEFVFSSNRL